MHLPNAAAAKPKPHKIKVGFGKAIRSRRADASWDALSAVLRVRRAARPRPQALAEAPAGAAVSAAAGDLVEARSPAARFLLISISGSIFSGAGAA